MITSFEQFHKSRWQLSRDKYPRRAGVLVPLCDVKGVPSILFTRRTQTVSTHKGQVAFPGGHRDDTDHDIVATSLREMREEIGWEENGVQVFGIFHDTPSITQVAVTPVIGYLGEVGNCERFVPSPAEIDLIFTVPMDSLKDSTRWSIDHLARGVVPRFKSEGNPDIWGLTGYLTYRIVDEMFGGIHPEIDVPWKAKL
uniref:Nudix hydrolase domain-containing protein n=1 Tax=Arcella intermedia TaxID=1963864 RepID=A0A6B2LJ25_9EUKA